MTVAVKDNDKTPLVVPSAVRRKPGFKSGQELEFKASGGVITIVPKLPNLTMPRRAPFTVHSTAPAIAGLRRVFQRSNPLSGRRRYKIANTLKFWHIHA
jgi:bifunctional DNA-binding transcriptional regulator/antitoxin component of YhaV-PrlF toxin-antitoxin module